MISNELSSPPKSLRPMIKGITSINDPFDLKGRVKSDQPKDSGHMNFLKLSSHHKTVGPIIKETFDLKGRVKGQIQSHQNMQAT